MDGVVLFCIGLAVGLAIGLVIAWVRVRDARHVAQSLLNTAEARHREESERAIAQLREAFGALSLEALSKNSAEFLQIANEKLSAHAKANTQALDGKKDLIDQTLRGMKDELGKVQSIVNALEKEGSAKFEVLSTQLNAATQETRQLRQSTSNLEAALANTQVRGQWGERMAEDVLRLAGFVEGINYRKQQSMGDDGKRPDYTFMLPQGRVLHMDVKFPLDKYLGFVRAKTDADREQYRTQFLRDARQRIDEVTKRDYIDVADDTLDYVLVFIPNEQIYAFLNEHDCSLIDLAMGKKVLLCSPITLYAILSVVRHAVDNFHLGRTASKILDLLAEFEKQWVKYGEVVDRVDKRLADARKAFDELKTTRSNQLEKPLGQIKSLRAGEQEAATPVRPLPEETGDLTSAESPPS